MSDLYYRILETDSGYTVATLQSFDENDYSPEQYAIPVKIYDENLAHEIQRKMSYDHHDEEFVRGVVEGVLLMRQDSVEYDPGWNPLQ